MSRFLRILIKIAAILTLGSLFALVGFVIIKGIPALNKDMFALEYNTDNLSIVPALATTLMLIVLTLLVAGPIGVFTGIYLIEYDHGDSKWVEVIRLATETLAGIPSIIYGLFGMLFFAIFLGWEFSVLSGVGTLSFMVLPLLIRGTEEALLRVPDAQRMASYALGAGKLRTIFTVVLPSATPGILSGVILSTGRIVGETAALMYTLGTATGMPKSVWMSGRSLALHMYILSSEGRHTEAAYATGVILLIMVLIMNGLSGYLAGMSNKGSEQ